MEASQTALNTLKDKSSILQKQGKIVFLQTSKKSHASCRFHKSDRVGSAASRNKESLSSSLQAAESVSRHQLPSLAMEFLYGAVRGSSYPYKLLVSHLKGILWTHTNFYVHSGRNKEKEM